MLRLSVGENLYQIKFHYTKNKGILLYPESFAGDIECEGIECTILKNGNIVAKTQAYCAPEDKFSAPVGRNIALIRAMKFFPGEKYKELRGLLWNEYFKLSPKSIKYMKTAVKFMGEV